MIQNVAFNRSIAREQLPFKGYTVFDHKSVEERQQLLLELIKQI